MEQKTQLLYSVLILLSLFLFTTSSSLFISGVVAFIVTYIFHKIPPKISILKNKVSSKHILLVLLCIFRIYIYWEEMKM